MMVWTLCTKIPIRALRYRLAGSEMKKVSNVFAGIDHGVCRWYRPTSGRTDRGPDGVRLTDGLPRPLQAGGGNEPAGLPEGVPGSAGELAARPSPGPARRPGPPKPGDGP